MNPLLTLFSPQKCYLWFLLIFLRFVFAIFLQNGYIHADEFFQSYEVMCQAFFNFYAYIPWEFQKVYALRSILGPLISIVFPYSYLHSVNYLLPSLISVKNVNLLIALPRAFVTLFSFSIDAFIVYLTLESRLFPGVSFELLYFLHCTSYITLVFFTRPLNNSLESFCLSLLWLSLFRKKREATSPDVKETLVPLSKSFLFFFVAAIFIRPTILIFCFVPIMVYLLSQLMKPNSINIINLVSFFSRMLFPSLLSIILFIFVDSIFYHFGLLVLFRPWILLPKIAEFLQRKRGLVITPLNFFLYNSKGENVESHGKHHLSTHVLLNLPLCYGQLPFIIFSKVFELFLNPHFAPFRELTFTLTFSLVCLSLIPHQEARFLLPLHLPILLLSAKIISRYSRTKKFVFLALWLIFNLCLAIFYSVLHQGGVVQALKYLQKDILKTGEEDLNYYSRFGESLAPTSSSKHVIFFACTYMPPRFILTLLNTEKKFKDIMLFDLKEANFHHVHKSISWFMTDEFLVKNISDKHKKADIHFWLFVPHSYKAFLEKEYTHKSGSLLTYKLHKVFNWHVSTEELIYDLVANDSEGLHDFRLFFRKVLHFLQTPQLFQYEIFLRSRNLTIDFVNHKYSIKS